MNTIDQLTRIPTQRQQQQQQERNTTTTTTTKQQRQQQQYHHRSKRHLPLLKAETQGSRRFFAKFSSSSCQNLNIQFWMDVNNDAGLFCHDAPHICTTNIVWIWHHILLCLNNVMAQKVVWVRFNNDGIMCDTVGWFQELLPTLNQEHKKRFLCSCRENLQVPVHEKTACTRQGPFQRADGRLLVTRRL